MTTFNFEIGESIDSDLMLLTSDGEHLNVHRVILKLASPVFEDSLKKAELIKVEEKETKELILKVEEDANTMRTLLSIIYPCPTSEEEEETRLEDLSLTHLIHLLRTATKYKITRAITWLSALLIDWMKDYPSDAIVVYAVGCVFKMTKLSQEACKAALKCSSVSLLESKFGVGQGTAEERSSSVSVVGPMDRYHHSLQEIMNFFSASDYQRLLKIHRERSKAMGDCIFKFVRFRRHKECTNGDCDVKYESSWLYAVFLVELVDMRGPNSDELFDYNCVFDCVAEIGCASCWKDIFGKQLPVMWKEMRDVMDDTVNLTCSSF